MADTCGVTISAFPPGQVCSEDDWCWANPTPQGNDLYDVLVVADDDIWAVGGAATIVHYDGSAWSGRTAVLFDLGFDPQPTFGDNLVNFEQIWRTGPNDYWITSNYGLLRGDGLSWSLVNVPEAPLGVEFDGIWGTGPANLWVGAKTDGVFHLGPDGWTHYSLDSGERVYGVHGLSASEIYVATNQNLRKFDGANWSIERSGSHRGASGTAATGLFAWNLTNYYQRIGTSWFEHTAISIVRHIAPISASEMWFALGYDDNTVAHFDGAWTYSSAENAALTDIELLSNETPVGVGTLGLIAFPTLGSTNEVGAPNSRDTYRDVAGTSSTDFWLGGSRSNVNSTIAIHHQGDSATEYLKLYGNINEIALAGDDVRMAGGGPAADPGGLYTLSGGVFSDDPGVPEGYYYDIWAANADSVWAPAGTDATIYTWSTDTWVSSPHVLSSSTVRFRDVWGRSNSNVWVVGTQGVAMKWNGATWAVHSPSADEMSGVWGWDDANVVAVGHDGIAHHYNGTEWGDLGTGLTRLTGICGLSQNDIYAARSDSPRVQHFDGSTWTTEHLGYRKGDTASTIKCFGGSVWALSHWHLVRKGP